MQEMVVLLRSATCITQNNIKGTFGRGVANEKYLRKELQLQAGYTSVVQMLGNEQLVRILGNEA